VSLQRPSFPLLAATTDGGKLRNREASGSDSFAVCFSLVEPENGNSSQCPEGYGTYRSKENCGAFYVCVAGTPVDFVCPGGTNYNEVSRRAKRSFFDEIRSLLSRAV